MTISPPEPVRSPFRVRVAADRDVVVVAPEGELDLCTLPDLAATVEELREAGFERLRLDLGGLSFVDSSGIRFVLQLAAQQSDRFDFGVAPGPPAVQRAFALAHVEHLIPFRGQAGRDSRLAPNGGILAGDDRLRGQPPSRRGAARSRR